MLPRIDTTIPNQINVKPGTYAGIYGGNQVVFPVMEGANFPLLQHQITFDGHGVRGMYDVTVIVTESSITIYEKE